MLFTRDYSFLTSEESIAFEEVKRREKRDESGKALPGTIHGNPQLLYPKAARHYLSLFPNNFLDQVDLSQNQDALRIQSEKYNTLINEPNIQESDVKAWIKEYETYHVVGSILSCYNFGHHSAYLFAEFPLGTSYKVDYLIVGENSDGYHFIFCEFESITSNNKNDKVTKKDGSFGNIIEKGVNQVDLWKNYLQSNFSYLENDFLKYKNPNIELPVEFRKYKPWQINYCVVAGKQSDFNRRSRELRMQYKSERNILILHYSNLYNYLQQTIGKTTFN